MRRFVLAPLAILLLLFVAGAEIALAQSARDLNTQGYRLYLKGKFPEALAFFRRAVAEDADYALARYNLACTLGVMRKRGPDAVCKYEAYRSAILDQLEEAVRLDPATRDKMQTDPDLDPVRDTVRYLKLLGYSPTNQQDVAPILVSVSWYGPPSGAFGPTAALVFRQNGTLLLTLKEVTGGTAGRTEFHGSFTVNANRIEITLDRPLGGATRFEGTMLPGGSLDLPGLLGPFTDDPHDCEA